MLPRAPCRTPLLYFGVPCHGNSVGYHENDVLSTVIFADTKNLQQQFVEGASSTTIGIIFFDTLHFYALFRVQE